MKEAFSPVLDDQPAWSDYLDFNSYVQALKDLIIHGKTRTPLTLGIFGRWGMGKTTLMQMLEKELKRSGMVTIWFNAWRYSNENELWAAFLQSMLNKIHNSLNAFQLPVFKTRLFFNRIKWRDAPSMLINFLIRSIVVILPLLLIDPISQQITPGAKIYLQAGGGFSALALAIWIVVKPLVEAVRANVSINIGNFQQTSNFQEHIAFLDKFREHFADIVRSLPKKGNKRLAVFIDDLDRCSPQQTIQVLDAIKLFVDIPGCVYVLGLDVDVVQKAVASKYADDPTAQREYMSKIIQIPFQLPPLTRVEMKMFLEFLQLDLPDPLCREVFVTGLVVNPREVKRTINIFSLLWNLAAKRADLILKITPVRLAKVVMIQQAFPELHKLLQQRPSLLIELNRFFREDAEEGNQDDKSANKKNNLHTDLLPFSKNEALRSMLLIADAPQPPNQPDFDPYGFSQLNADNVAIYFTLTNRAEAPQPEARFRGMSDFAPGYIIGGRYQVKYMVGEGGMSSVYLAYDQRLHRDVAIKIMRINAFPLEARERLIKRSEREIQILSNLEHPNLISILDSGVENEVPYYVMEYKPDGTLRDLLARKKVLSNKEIGEILLPILDALDYIHRNGIIHRDIKPSTILFDNMGNPMLSDFGVSKILNKQEITNLTGTGIGIGTPEYMSPEQSQGKDVDARTDIYALGVVLYEMITGRKPFIADTPMAILLKQVTEPVPLPTSINPKISVKMEKIVIKLLQKDPKDRYQSAVEVKEDLQRILLASNAKA
jgi:hypothetical protein